MNCGCRYFELGEPYLCPTHYHAPERRRMGGELDESDGWCRREDCQYRNWRSGSMPTHRRSDGCP